MRKQGNLCLDIWRLDALNTQWCIIGTVDIQRRRVPHILLSFIRGIVIWVPVSVNNNFCPSVHTIMIFYSPAQFRSPVFEVQTLVCDDPLDRCDRIIKLYQAATILVVRSWIREWMKGWRVCEYTYACTVHFDVNMIDLKTYPKSLFFILPVVLKRYRFDGSGVYSRIQCGD